MYKGLDVWLKMMYHDGKPSATELQSALDEDDDIINPRAPDHDAAQANSPSYTEPTYNNELVDTLQ